MSLCLSARPRRITRLPLDDYHGILVIENSSKNKNVEKIQVSLTLILLKWTIWRAPSNASKWRMGFNSAFKGLNSDKNDG